METRLACQLYSVHASIERDAASAVRAAARLGFDGLEFYGDAMWSVPFVRSALRDTGLEIAGWHVGLHRLAGDELERTLDFHEEIGNRALVVPWLPEEMRSSADAWRRTADLFNNLVDHFMARGMTLGYHNHEFEFRPLEKSGEIGWDLFARHTRPEIALQLDSGNAMAGGADPVAALCAHPRRGRTLHLKPFSRTAGFDCMIGQDDLPWQAFFREVRAQGVTEWLIAEYESDAMGSDLQGLKALRCALMEYGL